MNSYERVMKTLQGQPVDRTPVMAVLCTYGGRLTNVPLPKLYTDVDLYVVGQQAIQKTFGLDTVLAPFDSSIIAEAFGGKPVFFDHQPPNMKRPAAANIDEAIELSLPNPHRTARLPFVLEATRRLAALYHGTIPIFAILPGPASLPVLMLGLEIWLDTVLFNEPAANRLLERSCIFWVEWANALIKAGADGLVVPEGMAPVEITTRELFHELLLPHIRTCFGQVNGPIVFHHAGGHINPVLDLISDLPNLVGVTVSSKDDLSEARQLLGSGPALLGNIDNLAFPTATADEIHTMATACLKTGTDAGPFLLCNSGADIPLKTPPENIHALREAAETFAQQSHASVTDNSNTLWICCGVLRAEIEELHRKGAINGDLYFLDSMLHMDPSRLETVLKEKLTKTKDITVLVYGDCCPEMTQLADRPGIGRVEAVNCYQMLLGQERYREMMRKEAFMLLPEWAHRWKEVIQWELELSETVARDLFKEHRRELVYLDTGLTPIPEKEIKECSAYTGLPWRTVPVALDHLLDLLLKAKTVACKPSKQKDAQ